MNMKQEIFLKKGDAGTSQTCEELVVKKYLNKLSTYQCLTNQSSFNRIFLKIKIHTN